MRIARSTGAVTGLLIALLGIWGALIPPPLYGTTPDA
jgi:hypothetical protein